MNSVRQVAVVTAVTTVLLVGLMTGPVPAPGPRPGRPGRGSSPWRALADWLGRRRRMRRGCGGTGERQ